MQFFDFNLYYGTSTDLNESRPESIEDDDNFISIVLHCMDRSESFAFLLVKKDYYYFLPLHHRIDPCFTGFKLVLKIIATRNL